MIRVGINPKPQVIKTLSWCQKKVTKKGCGFYVKESINFKPRKDLEITYSDEDNGFQCSWIELLNEKRPNILVGVF